MELKNDRHPNAARKGEKHLTLGKQAYLLIVPMRTRPVMAQSGFLTFEALQHGGTLG
jgi:hypothetical protein